MSARLGACVVATVAALLVIYSPTASAQADPLNCIVAGICVDTENRRLISDDRASCRDFATNELYNNYRAGVLFDPVTLKVSGIPLGSILDCPEIALPRCRTEDEEVWFCVGMALLELAPR